MRSVLTGWWSWLVALFGTALAAFAILGFFIADEADDGRVAGSIIGIVLAVMIGVGLVVRQGSPRLGAWLIVIGVVATGIGFFWLLFIPTVLAALIVISGFTTEEISLVKPKPAGETPG